MTTIVTIKSLLAECRTQAREQGWTGEDAAYNYTTTDLDYITDRLGCSPTAEQWRDAGLQWVGNAHVGDGIAHGWVSRGGYDVHYDCGKIDRVAFDEPATYAENVALAARIEQEQGVKLDLDTAEPGEGGECVIKATPGTLELNISSSNPEPEEFAAFCEKRLTEQYPQAEITVRVVNSDHSQTGSIRVDISDLWHEYCNK